MKNNHCSESLLHSFQGLERTKKFYEQLNNYGSFTLKAADKKATSGFEHPFQEFQSGLWQRKMQLHFQSRRAKLNFQALFRAYLAFKAQ